MFWDEEKQEKSRKKSFFSFLWWKKIEIENIWDNRTNFLLSSKRDKVIHLKELKEPYFRPMAE